MIKKSERYAMLQLPKEVHTALKDYCDERGYKMPLLSKGRKTFF